MSRYQSLRHLKGAFASVVLAIFSFYASPTHARCPNTSLHLSPDSKLSESCWKESARRDLTSVTISISTITEILGTAERISLKPEHALGSIQFLKNMQKRLSAEKSDDLVYYTSGDRKCSVYFSSKSGLISSQEIPECSSTHQGLSILLILHYICRFPEHLLESSREKPTGCDQRLRRRLATELNLNHVALALARLLDDRNILDNQFWFDDEVQRHFAIQRFEESDRTDVRAEFASFIEQMKIGRSLALRLYQKDPPSKAFRLVVGGAENTRVKRVAEAYANALQDYAGGKVLASFEFVKLEDLGETLIAAARQGDRVAVVVDTTALGVVYARLDSSNGRLNDKFSLSPVARLGREELFLWSQKTEIPSLEALRLRRVAEYPVVVGISMDPLIEMGGLSADSWVLRIADSEEIFGKFYKMPFATGTLAATALQGGAVTVTLSNLFEAQHGFKKNNIALLASLADVPDWTHGMYPISEVPVLDPSRQIVSNIYLGSIGLDKLSSAFLVDAAVYMSGTKEWRKFLKDKYMTDVEPYVIGDELNSVEASMRP